MRRHPFVRDTLVAPDHRGQGWCEVCKLPEGNRRHGDVPDNSASRYEVDRDETQQ